MTDVTALQGGKDKEKDDTTEKWDKEKVKDKSTEKGDQAQKTQLN